MRSSLAAICMASALLFVSFSCLAFAQSSPANEPTREQLQTQIAIMKDYIKKLEENAGNRSVDPELQKAYIAVQKKRYEYLAAVFQINIDAYRAQQTASTVILFLVVFVVAAGILFAGFQLWKSVSVAGVQSTSDLEVSASKVRVTSSVVGVVVLTLSLVFLYIYTKEVYHIRVVGAAAAQTDTAPTK